MIDLAFLTEAFLTLIPGIPLTLKLAGLSLAVGALLSVLFGVLATIGGKLLSQMIAFYVFCIRGTPLLVQIFIVYYGMGQFRPFLQEWGVWFIFREPFWCAIIALTLNTTAYGSEIVRGGLRSVPAGQIEAARACGMSGLLLYRRIILPIAFRQALPAYGNEIVLMIKATSLASIITMMEVTGLAAKLISETFRAFEVFLVAGAIYLTINFLITQAVSRIEYWLSPHLRNAPAAETGNV
jgi:octopine/nopaline transport system permease protein